MRRITHMDNIRIYLASSSSTHPTAIQSINRMPLTQPIHPHPFVHPFHHSSLSLLPRPDHGHCPRALVPEQGVDAVRPQVLGGKGLVVEVQELRVCFFFVFFLKEGLCKREREGKRGTWGCGREMIACVIWVWVYSSDRPAMIDTHMPPRHRNTNPLPSTHSSPHHHPRQLPFLLLRPPTTTSPLLLYLPPLPSPSPSPFFCSTLTDLPRVLEVDVPDVGRDPCWH